MRAGMRDHSLEVSIDMVSCGPTILHPHSPEERVHVGSVERFWDFMKGVLESM